MRKKFNNFKNRSITLKIIIILIIVVIFGTAGFSVFLRVTVNKIMMQQITEKGFSILRTVSQTIDADQYSELVKSKDSNSPYYKQMIGLFNKIRKKTGVKYLYTESYLDDKKTTIYVFDGNDQNDENFSPLGSLVNEKEQVDTPEGYKALNEGTETYTQPYHTKEWGNLMSAYIPIKDTNGIVLGFIGCDFAVEDVQKTINVMFLIIFSSLLLVMSIMLIVMIILLTKISKPIIKITGTLSENVQNVSEKSQQLANTSKQLAKANISHVGFIKVTSSTLIVASNKISDNSENAQKASQIAVKANDFAQICSTNINEMINVIVDIQNASLDIGKIIKVIEDIAMQTRILALNAAVEAARAGEDGVGFGVVAVEVKNLSQRSSQAVKDIAQKLKDNLSITEKGSKIADKVGTALSEITLQVSKVSNLVEEIAKNGFEQSNEIKVIEQSILEIEKNTKDISEMTEESAQAAEVFEVQAEDIRSTVLKLEQLMKGTA